MDRVTTSVQTVTTLVKSVEDIFSSGDLLYGGDAQRRLVFVDQLFYHKGNWASEIQQYFLDRDVEATIIPIECLEETKDLETLLYILGQIERFNILRRKEPIIAIGGGVLMDMVGFAASMFRRGVPYIKVPTTLLGSVDAGVGAKTSINHFERRNRLGSYFPPIMTLIDNRFLKTLDKKEILFSLGEIIKISIIKDKKLFEYLEEHLVYCLDNNFTCSQADVIITESINGMLDELEPNLWEKDLQRVVDFGHSFSPVPEMKSLEDPKVYSLSHGEAVLLDVIFSCKVSKNRGLLSEEEYRRIIALCDACNLRTSHPYFKDPYLLWDSLLDATRHRDGNQNLPIPTSIGKAIFINDLTLEEVVEGVK